MDIRWHSIAAGRASADGRLYKYRRRGKGCGETGKIVTHEIRAFLPYLGQARHDAAPALRAAVARAAVVRRARFRLRLLRRASFPPRRKLDVVAQPLCGRRRRAHQAAAHRADGLYRAALSSAAACRGDRASSIRCSAGAWSSAWCPASIPTISARSASTTGNANRRRSNSSIICARRIGETQPFSFHGEEFHTDDARACGAAGAAPASAAMDDEPRPADA